MMLSVFVRNMKRDIVVAVQKSGFAWALDRHNGNLVWVKQSFVPSILKPYYLN